MWHAIAWGTLCQPKEQGEVGLKSLRLTNDAFLSKILWRLHTNPTSLWAQVLFGKYGRGGELHERPIPKSSDSQLWKGLARVWENFNSNVRRLTNEQGEETVSWQLTHHGQFTTRSAYQQLLDPPVHPLRNIWKRIWKLKTPERVCIFLWRCMHKKLPTMHVTKKWESGSGLCLICNQEEEDVAHALRDCRNASLLWRRFVPPEKRVDFFGSFGQQWISDNMNTRGTEGGTL